MSEQKRPYVLPSGDMISPPSDAPGIPAWAMLAELTRGVVPDAYRAPHESMKTTVLSMVIEGLINPPALTNCMMAMGMKLNAARDLLWQMQERELLYLTPDRFLVLGRRAFLEGGDDE